MNLHQGLAERVAALRQRLEDLGPSSTGPVAAQESPAQVQLQRITQHLATIREHHTEIETTLNDLVPPTPSRRGLGLPPPRLTWRTRHCLMQGRDLLDRLKKLAEDVTGAEHEGLGTVYRQNVALIETALRSVQLFPETATEQQRWCEGLEAILTIVTERVSALEIGLARRRAQRDRVRHLAELQQAMLTGPAVDAKPFRELAESLLHEMHQAAPLRLLLQGAEQPALWTAAHCLNVAQVMARLVRHDPEWRSRQMDAVVCGLLFDAGMTLIAPEILTQTAPLTDEQRSQLEEHVAMSLDGVARVAPAEAWLADAVAAHHERLDGTGYPSGAQGAQIPRLARLLAVCDVYVSLSSPRPHRTALSSRAALTETLLEAEKGRLDTVLAEYLLDLSFYPVGTAVELADGQVGMVVATNPIRGDLSSPARPVVQILANADGKPLPCPEFVNLAQCEGRHIVRSLDAEERQHLLGERGWLP
jgi:HD-GYP domain-containing protein (c-di-GMP phosphodiesterase class II)